MAGAHGWNLGKWWLLFCVPVGEYAGGAGCGVRAPCCGCVCCGWVLLAGKPVVRGAGVVGALLGFEATIVVLACLQLGWMPWGVWWGLCGLLFENCIVDASIE